VACATAGSLIAIRIESGRGEGVRGNISLVLSITNPTKGPGGFRQAELVIVPEINVAKKGCGVLKTNKKKGDETRVHIPKSPP